MRFQLAVVLLLAALLALWDPLVSCRAAPLPPNTAPVNCSESVSCLCTDVWTVWMFEPQLCPATSPFPSLCTSKPCSDCVKADGCGWCDSTCVPGTDSAPYYGSCVSWHSSVCPVVLARNVWWLWAMFAVLMLSMLTTALGICFFKRCRAVINGTPVSGEHTPPTYETKLYMSAESENEHSDPEQVMLDH